MAYDIADAFHPRQRIFTDPVHPTHPRQTLINSAAPPEPPKILPNLPNIVQFQQMTGPARPRLQISQETLSKLRPRERHAAKLTETPLPDVPTFEQKPAEITLAVSPNAPARPKLELNAGAAPRVAPLTTRADVDHDFTASAKARTGHLRFFCKAVRMPPHSAYTAPAARAFVPVLSRLRGTRLRRSDATT